MQITKLELKGYRRLMLGAYDHLIYTPESKIQIILGTNGSGKSSLLQQLSPLPASPQDFVKGGFKKVWIDHEGTSYYLESSFRSSAKHSLLRYSDAHPEGEELNPGNTGQVQKDLVQRIFGWTQALHDLLTKQERFTRMSPSRRREWIMQLSTADYRYATDVFNRIQSNVRDAAGTIKHLNQRLANEQQGLQSLAEYEGLDSRVDELRSELNLLLMAVDSNARPAYQVEQQLQRLSAELGALSRKIIEFQTDPNVASMEQVTQHRIRLEQNLETVTEQLNKATQQFSELEYQIQELGQNDIEVPDNLTELIAQSTALIERLQVSRNRPWEIQQPTATLQQTQSVYTEVYELLGALPDNSDRRYAPAHAQAARDAIAALQARIDQSNAKLAFIRHRKSILESTKETQCPQCQFSWREGFDAREIAQLDTWFTEHGKIIEQAEAEIKPHQDYLNEFSDVSSQYSRFRTLTQNYPLLSPFWSLMIEEQRHLNQPIQSRALLQEWQQDCERQVEIDTARAKLEQLQLIERRVADGTLNHMAHRKRQLTEQIAQYTTDVRERQTDVATARTTERRYQQMLEQARRLVELQKQYQQLITELYRATANTSLETQVAQHQDQLATINRNLNDFNTLKGIVNDLERDAEQVTTRHQALAILAQELSPVSGLIAEDMAGFINCVLEQMNAVIQSIWTYDLSILPCEMESGDLNYRFPLSNAKGAPVQDVSRGSEAQQDLVDFAFTLTVLMFKDLPTPPLYLDELGASFDEQHRINVMGFVKQLMDSHRYSQLFFISHYASQYSAMAAAQIAVLESSNVAVPQQHNEHIQFQ